MVIAGLIITGPGIGISLIGSMTSAQNALHAEDIGAGTGALLVLRAVGGACGSTLAGTVISAANHTASGFKTLYEIAAAFAAVMFIVALTMPNTVLRSSMHTFSLPE